MCWNPGDVGSNASEGMDALTKQGQTGKEQIFLLSLCSSRRCGPSCLPVSIFGLKVCVFLNQDPNKGLCLPISRFGSKVCVFLPQRFKLGVDGPTSNQQKISHRCAVRFWNAVYSKYSQLDNQG